MSYLQDRKLKRKEFSRIVFFAIFFIVLFYFRTNIFYGLSYISNAIFRPILILGNNISDKLKNISVSLVSKNSLYLENENLKLQLSEMGNRIINYNVILDENTKFKEILGRLNEKIPMILAAILAKPNQSAYDTLIIDVGAKQGLQIRDMVFALGNVPIGRIAEVYNNSSKVILFSNSGEKTQAVISGRNIFIEIIGRGGGNFEVIMPRDIMLQKGDQAVLPRIIPYVVGTVETIIFDPRDSFQKALLVSPVNIQELKFVEVAIN